MLVQEFLSASAARYPDKVALVCGAQRITYSDMDGRVTRLARALREQGVERGDRVVLFMDNALETALGIFAVARAGGVFVVVNRTTKQDKLQYILQNCRAKAFFTEGHLRGLDLEGLFGACPSLAFGVLCGKRGSELPLRCLDFDTIQATTSDALLPSVNIDLDLACLVYTSGSTGDPKGVMSDHANVDFASSSIISYLENTPEDIVLCLSPLSFDYGLYQLLMVVKFGGTLVLERSFTYPAVILQRIEAEKVTGFPGVPTVFAMLLPMDLRHFDLSSLRYLSNTAAALPSSHIRDLQSKFPGVTIYSMYGLTETKRTLYLPPSQLSIRPDSVGIAIPGTEVWVQDDEGRRLGPDQVGELIVRGRHVMRGYWEAPEATAARYRPGPLPGERVCHTGDLFRMDAEGYFYFVGRKDDIIKSRGEKVAPKEVENVLHLLPGVAAAVIGVPDPVLGQAVKAVLVNQGEPLTEAQVLAHCKAHLEDFMVPRYVEFRSEFPLTSTGKIAKREL